LPAIVGCNLLGTAETSNPDGDEGLRDCFCGDLREWVCLRPAGVSVDGSETVPETRKDRQGPDQVDMHMRETCRREVETPERGLYVPPYLGTLVECTRACPFPAVFSQSRPHKTLGHQRDIGVDLVVAKASKDLTWRLKGVVINGRGCGVDVSSKG
jgi:hypothetical protein